jgi:hypothetical protein
LFDATLKCSQLARLEWFWHGFLKALKNVLGIDLWLFRQAMFGQVTRRVQTDQREFSKTAGSSLACDEWHELSPPCQAVDIRFTN